tara:strand:- start:6185 stop:6790 length:606 start_codon:yes stop_codon:yes gene_type:complete
MAETFLEDSRVDNKVNNLSSLIEGADGDTSKELDMFNAPTPGQSLTDEPGSRPWEKPPKFSKPQDALQAIQTKFRSGKTQQKLVEVMDAGMPLQVLTKSITMGGFREGLWTPDVAELLNPPVFMLLGNLARKYKIKPVLFHKGAVQEAKDAPENMLSLTQAYKPDEFEEMMDRGAPEEEAPMEEGPMEEASAIGFMPRGGE